MDAEIVNSRRYEHESLRADCCYGLHIDSHSNDESTFSIVKLPSDILTSHHTPTSVDYDLCLHIATVVRDDPSYGDSVVLHPDYPASEPLVVNVITSFGKRFGVPFQVSHGPWFTRSLSSMKLLSCYSIKTLSLKEPSIILNMDAVVDTLLLGCLPRNLASCLAQSLHCTNITYEPCHLHLMITQLR